MDVMGTVGIVLLVLLVLAVVVGIAFWVLYIISEGYRH